MANTQHISTSKNFAEKEFPDNISMNTLMSNNNSRIANNLASSFNSEATEYLVENDDQTSDADTNAQKAFGNTGLKSFKKKMKGVNVNSKSQNPDTSKSQSLRDTNSNFEIENNKNVPNIPIVPNDIHLSKIEEKFDESELENTFERMRNMSPRDMEKKLDQSYISIIEEKSAQLYHEFEDHVYAKRMTEKYRKNLELDLNELADERDKISEMLFREREIKRVFEKEVGK